MTRQKAGQKMSIEIRVDSRTASELTDALGIRRPDLVQDIDGSVCAVPDRFRAVPRPLPPELLGLDEGIEGAGFVNMDAATRSAGLGIKFRRWRQ